MGYSAYNTIAENTIGKIWTLFGANNPFTVNEQAMQQAHDQLIAQGLDPNDSSNSNALQQAYDDAKPSIEEVMSSAPTPTLDCTKQQTDIGSAIICSLKKFEEALVIIIILVIVLYLFGKHLSSPTLRVRGRV